MAAQSVVTESRDVGSFDRIVLKPNNMANEIVIRQDGQESLAMSARPDVLSRVSTRVRDGQLIISIEGSFSDKLGDALATSLSRPVIRYQLTVRSLTGLDISGFARVSASGLETERLAFRFQGAGDVHIAALRTGLLEVDFQGAGRITMAGKATEQKVNIGMGVYSAPRLESKSAKVTLKGVGQATVWATDSLEATIHGPGSVEYYGTPRVTAHASPLGRVTPVGRE